jgi:syncollin
MSKNFTLAAAALVAIVASGTAHASCTLYQHRDYGESKWTLRHLERMKMVNGESVGCTTNGHGGGCESIIYNASWNDHVSSFKVTSGCTLTLWQHVNAGGARFRSSKSYKYVGDAWNDEASEALCMCR